MNKLEKILNGVLNAPVYYLSATEAEPLREAAVMLRRAIAASPGSDGEVTRIDGPAPDMGQVVAAAGAINFFGQRRVVELWEISPSAIGDRDAAELAELFGMLQNAVLVVSALHRDKKAAAAKKAKLLYQAAEKYGFAAEIEKPTRQENLLYLHSEAKKLNTSFGKGAAEALLERCGESRPLLCNETARLAAMCGYGCVDKSLVERYSVRSVEADAFELARAVTAGRRGAAFQKLNELAQLRYEPLAVAGALAGVYVDMLRVRAGQAAKKDVSAVFTDMGGKGSEYRMQKARENAGAYTYTGLQRCILCLARLDTELKSSALTDKWLPVQAALGELMEQRR